MESFVPHQPLGKEWAYDVAQAQEATKKVLDDITRHPQLGAELLINPTTRLEVSVALTAGVENLVEHGLGKEVRGWRIVDIRGPALVWRITSPATTGYVATKHLALSCSADVTVKLEVYA